MYLVSSGGMWECNGSSHHSTRTSNLCLYSYRLNKKRCTYAKVCNMCVWVTESSTRQRAASMHILIRSEAAEKQISRFFAKTCAIKMKHKIIVNNAGMDYKANEKNKSAGCLRIVCDARAVIIITIHANGRQQCSYACLTSLCHWIGNTFSLASLTTASRAGGRGADSSMEPCVISRFIQAF